MKIFACAALLTLALAVPASAATITAYENNFDDPVYTAAGVTASLTGWDYVVATGGDSYGDWSGKQLFNLTAPVQASTFTLANLPTHTSVSLSFVLGFLGSWDSIDGDEGQAPDYLYIFIDGAQVAELTYNNGSGTVKRIGGGTLLVEDDPSFAGPDYTQTLVDMSTAGLSSFAHSSSNLTFSVIAGGAGWDGGSSQEWGLDGLKVALSVPEPATWSLMIGGFGLVGAMLRRRRTPLALTNWA